MKKERLVMIGNGMAGVRTIEEILERDLNRYEITIIGEEAYPNYNRIMLSNVLQNKMTTEEIITNPYAWYEENQIDLINHDPALTVDVTAKQVGTQSGKCIHYDKLLMATGSRAFILPIEGSQLEGVIGFRTIDDTNTMLKTAKNYQKATVIGGGLARSRGSSWTARSRHGCHGRPLSRMVDGNAIRQTGRRIIKSRFGKTRHEILNGKSNPVYTGRKTGDRS